MKEDEFEMSEDLVRRIVVSKDGSIKVFGRRPSNIVLSECPKVCLEGHAYLITGPVDEVVFKALKGTSCDRYWNVLAVDLELPPEADGRLVCKALLCDRVGSGLWRVEDETVTCYTDKNDTEEFGSHPVYNPETLEIERSTEKCDFL